MITARQQPIGSLIPTANPPAPHCALKNPPLTIPDAGRTQTRARNQWAHSLDGPLGQGTCANSKGGVHYNTITTLHITIDGGNDVARQPGSSQSPPRSEPAPSRVIPLHVIRHPHPKRRYSNTRSHSRPSPSARKSRRFPQATPSAGR